jgi:hypothetical protein
MDTFTIIRQALQASATADNAADLSAEVRDAGRVIHAVQTVVDLLTPPDGRGKYEVSFVDIQTAATDLSKRRIIVSSRPLRDRNLTLEQKAVVVTTFAAHEIGHTIVTRPRAEIIRQHNAKSGYHAVANLADDIILEPHMAWRYPILQDAFAFTGKWVLTNTAKHLPRVEQGTWTTTPERFNTLISATRYDDSAPIVWATPKAVEEREWGRDWAQRLIALRLTDHDGFLALCDEAWERIRTKDDDDIEIEEPPTDGPTGPGGDEPPTDEPPTDGPTQPGDEPGDEGGDEPPTDGPTGKGKGKPTDEDGDGEDADDEPGDDGSGDADDEDGDEDGDPNDAPTDWDDDDDDGDDEGNPGDDDGDDDGEGDDESDEDGEDGGEDADDEPGGEDEDGPIGHDKQGGGGNADAGAADMRDEDEWNDDEVVESTHSEANPTGYDPYDDLMERQVREYSATARLDFGRHGKMSITWS